MAHSRQKYKYLTKASDSKINYSMVNTNLSNIETADIIKPSKNLYKFPDI